MAPGTDRAAEGGGGWGGGFAMLRNSLAILKEDFGDDLEQVLSHFLTLSRYILAHYVGAGRLVSAPKSTDVYRGTWPMRKFQTP